MNFTISFFSLLCWKKVSHLLDIQCKWISPAFLKLFSINNTHTQTHTHQYTKLHNVRDNCFHQAHGQGLCKNCNFILLLSWVTLCLTYPRGWGWGYECIYVWVSFMLEMFPWQRTFIGLSKQCCLQWDDEHHTLVALWGHNLDCVSFPMTFLQSYKHTKK